MARKKSTKKKDGKKNEVIGIIFIGLAVFTAITVYFRIGSVVGDVIAGLIFGLCGAVGYAVPPLIAVAGVLFIMSSKKYANKKKLALLGVAMFFVFALVHLGIIESVYIQSAGYGGFIQNSFEIGVRDTAGGGVIGALPTYWTYAFLGLAGSYIICIVGIVAMFLLLTNLSLKKMGSGIGATVKATYDGYKANAAERRAAMAAGKSGEAEKPRGTAKTPKPRQAEEDVFTTRQGAREAAKNKKRGYTRQGPEAARLYIENLELEESERESRERETRFAKKLRTLDDSVNKQYEQIKKEEESVPEVEYDPMPYRKVFEDTDIEFEDIPQKDRRGKRKIDMSSSTASGDKSLFTAQRRAISAEIIEQSEVKHNNYSLPPVSFLSQPVKGVKNSAADLRKNVEILEKTLQSFNVEAKVVNVSQGPVVTRYEVQPAAGVKVSRIVSLSDDIAMNLSAKDVRIEAPVPGKPVVGIEIPNSKTTFVGIRELIATEEFENLKSPLAFTLGKDIAGANVYGDITKMPHVLIAGATGSGKSVCINSLITSILYHASPEDVNMIMIDPKMVELNAYNGIPHLRVEVVIDPKKASSALNWAVNEMTMRYRMFAAKGAKDLPKYNSIITAEGQDRLPYIVVVVDELADLMMVAPGEVEESICRIAQLGRASGIHLVVATQRPSVNVITGVIKANIPSRIAFAVSSQVDSRTILDMQGAEKLLGQGDMLYYPAGAPKPIRLQGCFISETEVEAVTGYLKEKNEVRYDEAVIDSINTGTAGSPLEKPETDALFMKAIETILAYEQASASMLQRRLRIGFSRAGRLMDQLEENNIVSPADSSNKRQILITKEQFEAMKGGEDGDAEDEWSV